MGIFNPKRYFLLTCKFGHVGRDKYLPLVVPIMASSPQEASRRAKRMGGIKKDHKDWCLKEPVEVSKEEYEIAQKIFYEDPYWQKHTRSNLGLFDGRLVDEPTYTRHRGIKTNTVTFKKPTPADVKEFRKKKNRIIAEDLDYDAYEEDE